MARNPKKPKLEILLCCAVVIGSCSVYSCKTSTHDDRGLVVRDEREGETNVICLHSNCKQACAVMVNGNNAGEFRCPHTDSLNSPSMPTESYLHLCNLEQYQCRDLVKEELRRLESACVSSKLPLVVKVSPTMVCVFGAATTNATTGYCHVRVTRESLKCCSKDCKSKTAHGKEYLRSWAYRPKPGTSS